MKIIVTAEHIKNGCRMDPCGCPVALAIRDVVKDDDVSVGPWQVHVGGKGIRLPPAAVLFVRWFDENLRPQPFEFELPVE